MSDSKSVTPARAISRKSSDAWWASRRRSFGVRFRFPVQCESNIPLDTVSLVVHIHTMMSKELDMSAVENCVCFNLRWVTRAVTQFYDSEMRRHGIRPTQGTILSSLQAKDSWSMAELSDWLGMERTTLVRNLRPLQRDGFVRVSGGGRGN